MNKKFLSVTVLSLLAATMSTGFTSCEDYDDDIDNLQVQIDGIKTTVADLEKLIQDGNVITSVTPTADGLAITFSNGKTYTLTNGKDGADGKDGLNGKDGKDGADGKDGKDGKSADVWTIGADGYWYKNGVKTDHKAVGVDGRNGTDGTNGEYYVPNAATGLFDIYRNGVKIGESDIRWRPEDKENLTAAFSGNKLTISGVVVGTNPDGTPKFGDVELNIGVSVGSIGFIPTVMSSKVAYPTTDKEFYHLTTYLSESKYNATTKVFAPQSDWNKSNIVDLHYRINPSDAYVVDNGIVNFIDRKVTSRAAGDNNSATPLLNVLTRTINKDQIGYFTLTGNELSVSTTVNASRLSTTAESNIAALSLWNGQQNTVSDYVAISSEAIDVLLVDSAYMAENPSAAPKAFYNRNKAIVENGETDAFIKGFVGLNDKANVELVYNSALNLRKLPGLYSSDKNTWLTKLGFTGMSYKFELPKEYKSDDAQGTNQQWFVELSGETLKVNSTNLTESLIPAIGRTPVVRIDAFLTSNDGSSKLVASAYIKVSIVKEPTQDPGEKDIIPCDLTAKAYEYHGLSATPKLINQMDWKDVNNLIYGKAQLTSSTFWNNYGGAQKEYEVKVTTTEKNGSTKVLGEGKAKANQAFTLTTPDGISCETTLGSGDTQTSNIKFSVDNRVKTQNTYKNVDGKGAEFVVTITIPSNNKAVRGNVVITQKFYVKDECVPYEFNPNYFAGNIDGKTDVVITKGKLVGGSWKLEMNISEVFEMRNGKNIFQYYNTVNNAKAISFSLNPTTQTGVSYTETTGVNGIITLTAALKEAYLYAGMKYTVTLVNNENCEFYFNIKFRNPFVAGSASQVDLNGNATGAVTAETAPKVIVNDVDGKTIYSWVNGSLRLSELATNTYKVAAPTVKYAFVKDATYNKFAGNLDPKATFKIDETTGIVTYDNLGATLIPSYKLTVKATVTFADLSEVVINIPFIVKGEKPL